MSDKREVERIKAHLGRTPQSQTRQVFGRAQIRVPWYSPYRLRNLVVLASLISLVVMSKPLYDLYWGIRRGIRFERERSKFISQLGPPDGEDGED